MKQILLFHPVGQMCAFICGLFNIITGITKRCFIVNIHINCGLLYYFISALGFIMGISVFSWAVEKGMKVSMQAHLLTGSVIMILFIVGAVSGFMLRQDTKNKQLLRAAHRWVNLLSMLLFIMQSITGGLALIRVL
jgi:hypothetical protein